MYVHVLSMYIYIFVHLFTFTSSLQCPTCTIHLRSHASGVCDTEYARSTTLKIGTALVNYYVPLAVMAVLYGRIFVAIRRRSKLEIWQNAAVVAGGGRTTWSGSSDAGTSRRLLDNCHENADESDGEEITSGSRRAGDDGKRAERQPPPSIVVDLVTSHKQPDRHDDELHGAARSTRLHTDHTQTPPPSPFEDESELSQVVGQGKCVRFLLVKQHESDSNDADLDQIEMWSVERSQCEVANSECANDSRLPGRPMPRLKHHSPKTSGYRSRQKQNSLSSEVKAAKQLGVIMGAFCICFLPYFVCFVVVAFCHQCVSDRLMITVTWIGYVNSTLNPFLYPLCNQQFRISFRRMFTSFLRAGTATRS